MKRYLILLASVLVFAGCATVEPYDYSAFKEAKPHSIMVVPVVNNSVDVEAPTLVLATLPKVIAEQGYYVYPVNTVKTVLEFEGMYEAAEVHQAPVENLAALFGADSILYVTIHDWTSEYVLLKTTTKVDFEYRIVNKDGTEIWQARRYMTYTPQSTDTGSLLGNLIADAVTAALEKAKPNYLPLTRQANYGAFHNANGALPPGPYLPEAYDEFYLEEPEQPKEQI